MYDNRTSKCSSSIIFQFETMIETFETIKYHAFTKKYIYSLSYCFLNRGMVIGEGAQKGSAPLEKTL